MQLLRTAAFLFFAFAGMLGSASATTTTYSWPLQASLPISISNATSTSTAPALQVQCRYYPKSGVGGGFQFNGINITPTVTNGVISYSGTVAISVNALAAESGTTVPSNPLSGDKITCTLVSLRGQLQTSGSTSSSLTLP